jgi:hypothetical protein
LPRARRAEEVYVCTANVAGMTAESAISKWFVETWTDNAWGKPKTETCEGFSIFEFQQLDLAAMDFSEVYADFMEAAKLPDEAAALVQIQQKIADYYAAHKP